MQSQSSDMFNFVPSTHNGNHQISYSDQAFYHCTPISIDSESNPTSKQQNLPSLPSLPLPPLSFSHFPSPPFEDTQIFLEQNHDFLLEFHHQPLPLDSDLQPVISTEQIQTKKTGKRDRHSKINTARGLRDRRMRLSLEVAKRFFGLQDMLGFDKASKTVDWLLNQAKVEINQLLAAQKNNQSASSTSDCEEGVSSLEEAVFSGNQEQQEKVPEVVKRKKTKHSRKSAFPLAKECRERARERARERTKEKIRIRGLVDESKQCREGTDHNHNHLSSWNPFQTAEKCATQNHTVNPSLNEAKEGSYNAKELLETLHTMTHDDSFAIFTKWESCPFNSLSNSGLLPQEHQFAESQCLGKPWEA